MRRIPRFAHLVLPLRLSGRELGVNAEIVFTGLRPGEKLHEELIVEGEDISRTTHPKVMKLLGSEKMPASWMRDLDELIGLAIVGNRFGVVEKLDALVKGYRPMYEFHRESTLETVPPDSDRPASPVRPPSKSLH